MRIVGDIPHPSLKITIFLHDSKYAVKFESGLYEQTYKFRSGNDLQTEEDIKAIIDANFIQQVELSLPKMHQQKLAAMGRWRSSESDDFEEII